MPAAMQANGLAPEEPASHGRGRGVLFVVGVQDEDAVERARDDRLTDVGLAGTAKHICRKFEV